MSYDRHPLSGTLQMEGYSFQFFGLKLLAVTPLTTFQGHQAVWRKIEYDLNNSAHILFGFTQLASCQPSLIYCNDLRSHTTGNGKRSKLYLDLMGEL